MDLAEVNVFTDIARPNRFIGRPFYFDFNKMNILSNDHWKDRVNGIPAGAFLTALYNDDTHYPEVVLLRVLGPTALPSDPDIIAAMVEHFKETEGTGVDKATLDSYTRYEFQFSGLECRVLGSFYRDSEGRTCFGADVDNFYGANNYSVFKPAERELEHIVNFREGECTLRAAGAQRIGEIRYASSRRHIQDSSVPLYVSATDYLGKRTALFGMTRTGKSNTVKKIIQATVDLGSANTKHENAAVAPIGQIIFDVNGEYANPNLQDKGTAIFELYKENTLRYSTHPQKGFSELKINFFHELDSGFDLIRSDPYISSHTANYVSNFTSVALSKPEPHDKGAMIRWQRRVAVYLCILNRAGFNPPANFQVTFPANSNVRDAVGLDYAADGQGNLRLTLREASSWWQRFWEVYKADHNGCFDKYKKDHDGRSWADDDLEALLTMLTRRRTSGGKVDCGGYIVLQGIKDKHTSTLQESFESDILQHLRKGGIVIVDLSLGDDSTKRYFSERLCRHIFNDAMRRFTKMKDQNFIQMYFEEAHNLFPRRESSDLSQIYNRIAKEGAKFRLGLIYVTQEVSSISANVLKNTQNWFVSHLNNRDELQEIAKYYDFGDFVDSLRRTTDKGFIRMKTYSNAFIVPVQVDRFAIETAL